MVLSKLIEVSGLLFAAYNLTETYFIFVKYDTVVILHSSRMQRRQKNSVDAKLVGNQQQLKRKAGREEVYGGNYPLELVKILVILYLRHDYEMSTDVL